MYLRRTGFQRRLHFNLTSLLRLDYCIRTGDRRRMSQLELFKHIFTHILKVKKKKMRSQESDQRAPGRHFIGQKLYFYISFSNFNPNVLTGLISLIFIHSQVQWPEPSGPDDKSCDFCCFVKNKKMNPRQYHRFFLFFFFLIMTRSMNTSQSNLVWCFKALVLTAEFPILL